MRIVTVSEMRALDARMIHDIGVPGVVLMENAGRAVAGVVAHICEKIDKKRIIIVCGPGNNGGDGYVAARYLLNWNAAVTAVRCVGENEIKGDARVHFQAARAAGVRMIDGTAEKFAAAAAEITAAGVVVDALLGTGITRPVTGHLATVIACMNQSPGIRVAVDLPSGLDADSGQSLGICFNANHTVTLAFPKIGMVNSPGFMHVGELHVADIGMPKHLTEEQGGKAELLDDSCLAEVRQPRDLLGHKGTYGHVLVVAGSPGHVGAALMTGEAAARGGAGLVTITAPDETVTSLRARVTEVMTAALGPDALDEEAMWRHLEPQLIGKSAIAFGPGVAPTRSVGGLLARLIGAWTGPMVIDADGLNLLAEDLSLLARRQAGSAPLVLTPHPAEMGRLARLATQDVQRNRAQVARSFALTHKVIVVLKGARTVIAAPDGRWAVNPTGNPGMATGGAGDVLTGLLAAMLASLPPFEAACAAVYLHGRAGDLVAAQQGEVGMLARDLIETLPLARLSGQLPCGRDAVLGDCQLDAPCK